MTTPKSPTPEAYQAACDALWAHRERAAAQAIALDAIRTWRRLQSHGDMVDFTSLDAVLDAAADGTDVPLRRLDPPSSLPEAVAAYRDVLNARAAALNSARLVWDQVEAAAIREIDQHMPERKTTNVEIVPDPPHVVDAIREVRRSGGLPPARR